MKIEKYKNNLNYSYTLGITITIELLKEKKDKIIAIYYSSKFEDGEGKKKIDELTKNANIIPIIQDKVFNILSPKENCYCIGVFEKYTSPIKEGNHIVLVNPANAGNLGTIIRSALGFNLTNIAIIKPAVDIFDAKTIRSSMGAIFKINFTYYDSFDEYQACFKHHFYPFMLKAKHSLKYTRFEEPASLIFGNEATGLDDSYLNFDSIIIPHSKNIDSLNLPIACSIAIYEFSKHNWE